jgi:hypothetical protein
MCGDGEESSSIDFEDVNAAVEDDDRVVAGRGHVVDLVLEEASTGLDHAIPGSVVAGGTAPHAVPRNVVGAISVSPGPM